MGRNIVAGVVGVIVAFVLVLVVEMIGHTVYPPPQGLDFTDAQAMGHYVATLPIGALLFVAGAWFVGATAGTCAACAIGTARPMNFALVIGGLVFIGASFNLLMFPHPLWFSVLGLVGILVGAGLGTMCRRAASDNAE
ncbi:MAG: hypothetical protein QNI98_11595 [Woeseiaceae bacterium]|nr:hypothetical protein [Woeseiaceae bacterium]